MEGNEYAIKNDKGVHYHNNANSNLRHTNV